MANTVYANKVIEAKAKDILTTAINARSMMTVDDSLAENAGMIKTINTYTYSGSAEEVAAGAGNTTRGSVSYVGKDYTVKMVQQAFDYTDEDFMKDNVIVDMGIKGATSVMSNKMTTDFYSALATKNAAGNAELVSGITFAKGSSLSYTTTTALTGDSSKFIKYYSSAAVATGAAARNSATLKSQKITCGAKNITTASGTISAVESGSFQFSATDSRGYTTTQTVTKTLVEYVKLTCSLDASAPTTAGVATLKINGNCFNGSFGAVANTLTVQYRYKTQGGTYSSWTAAAATKSGNTYSASVSISGLDYKTTYIFQARALDKLDTKESNEQTRNTLPVFDWGKDDFKVNGDFHVTGATALDGNLTGKYLTGTWLQTTAATDLNSTPSKVAVLDDSGWIYSRTPSELKSDMGLSNIFKIQTLSPKEWSLPANSTRSGEIKGTINGYSGYTPIFTKCYCINSSQVVIINAWVTGSYSSSGNGYTWHIDARNLSSSKITANFTMNLLWIKTSLFG